MQNFIEFLNYVLFGLIISLQMGLAIIPIISTGKLYYKNNKGFKKFPPRGRIFFIMGLCLIVITFVQFILSNKINDAREQEKNTAIERRDSVNQFNTVKLLARYGLKVDTKNDEIVRILRDSSMRKTTIINGNDPYFLIGNIKMRLSNDTTYLTLWYCSKEAPSYNVDVLLDVLVYDLKKDSFSYMERNLREFPNAIIPKEDCLIIERNGVTGQDYTNSMFVFRVHGKYENSQGKKIRADYISTYDLVSKTRGALNPEQFVKYSQFIYKK